MKYELSGVSTPLGGISWSRNAAGKDMFSYLLIFLESKRILVNPIEMEKKEWCIESVLEIRNTLVSAAQNVSFAQFDTETLRKMIDGCNAYLDAVSPMALPAIIFKNGDKWEDISFDNAMKAFRNVFRAEIANIESHYGLQFAKQIPEQF